MPARETLLLLAFLLSGFAGLVYQTAWSREFAFVFGTSELAVSSVLAATFAGLAAGAALVGRVVSRVRRPLRVYALLELGIGATALAVPAALHLAMRLHVALFASGSRDLEEAGVLSGGFYLVAAFVILMLPTGLMGATLPLLSRHRVRRDCDVGPRVGGLYAVNTLGAVLGVVAAGFWLLPAFGLRRTEGFAALLNVAAFVLARTVARRERPISWFPSTRAPTAARRPRIHWILPLIGISGAVSFLYEVLWTRLLVHALGGSIYAFATMLASFLAGIALGSGVASRWAHSPRRALRGFALVQLGTALLSAGAYACLDHVRELTSLLARFGAVGAANDTLVAGALLLPSATAIGATFPLAVRCLARDASDAGVASARVYTWNTLGAIAGAVGAGFLLIPALGFAGALALAVAANLALAAAAGWKIDRHPVPTGGLAIAGLLLLVLHPLAPPWRLLRTSPFASQPTPGRIVYHGVGRHASALVLEADGEYLLRLNGLPESVIQPPGARAQRYSVAHWLGALPALLHPGLESLLVVGLGGGIALEGAPPSLRSIDVIEIEREALQANRAVSAERREDPLADPRVRVHINDARNGLLLTQRRFDAIVSQPSHPWTSGAAPLYTREFFQLVRSRLNPGGVFVQWIGLRFVDASLLRTLVATLHDVFPHVRAYRPGRRPALLFAASAQPFPNREGIATEIEHEQAHLRGLGLFDWMDLEAAWVLDETGATLFAQGAPLNLDGANQLEMRSPAVTRSSAHRSPLIVLQDFDPLPRRAAAYRPTAMIRHLSERGELERARRFLSRAPVGAERKTAQALLSLARGHRRLAWRELREALLQDPRHPEARAALLRLAVQQASSGSPPLAAPLTGLESACWEGWRRRRAGDWQGVRVLEAQLARASPQEPLFRAAARLRAWWRVASREATRAREALDLIDPVLAGSEHPADLLLRSQAAERAGAPRGTVASLSELLSSPKSRTLLRREAGRAAVERLIAALPAEAPFSDWKRGLGERLERVGALPSRAGAP